MTILSVCDKLAFELIILCSMAILYFESRLCTIKPASAQINWNNQSRLLSSSCCIDITTIYQVSIDKRPKIFSCLRLFWKYTSKSLKIYSQEKLKVSLKPVTHERTVACAVKKILSRRIFRCRSWSLSVEPCRGPKYRFHGNVVYVINAKFTSQQDCQS